MKRLNVLTLSAFSITVALLTGCNNQTAPPNPLEPVERASAIPSIADSHNNDVADLTNEMNSAE